MLVNGTSCNYLARLLLYGPLRITACLGDGGACRLFGEGEPGRLAVLQSSQDLRQWTPVLTNPLAWTPVEFFEPQSPDKNLRFYRLWTP